MRRHASVLWFFAPLALIACGPTNNTVVQVVDAGSTSDVVTVVDRPVASDVPVATDVPAAMDRPAATDVPAAMDRPATDATGTDGIAVTDRPATDAVSTDRPTGTDVPVDVPPPSNTCATSAILDLNTLGTRMGETTRYVGTTAMAPERGILTAPCATSDHYQLALRYTPRASTRLRISTANPGTAAMFDSVVWVQSMCAPLTMGMSALGCNDDGGQMPNTYASIINATSPLTAGTPVFIFVGGYGTGAGNRGAFELTVTELTEVAAGMACNPLVNVCATGSSCVGAAGMQRCTADGSSGGACRTAMGAMPCDMGLTCSMGLCVSSIAIGMPCGGTITAPCATGSICAGPAGMQRCTADGAAGGRCRTAMGSMPCDAMLTCVSARCVTTVAVGGACDPTNVSQVCAMGSSCAPMGTTTATTCQRDSTAAGTPCLDAAPLCAMGLTCDGVDSSSACRRPGTAGGACDLRFNSVACPMGQGCLGTSATAATCTAVRMETEPNNSATMAQSPITAGTVFSGAVGAMTDPMDCFGVTVPANGTVVVETSTPGHPGCDGNDTLVTLSNAMGTEVARNDDGFNRGLCSYLNATRLAAGTYAVCVRAFGTTPIASYYAAIGVYGP